MLGKVYDSARREEGVTLVELIIVMVLVAILALLGAGAYRYQVQTAYDRQAKANLIEANEAANEIFEQNRQFDSSKTLAGQLESLRPERRFYEMPAAPADVDDDNRRLQGAQKKPAIYVRSAPSVGDEADSGQVTLCTQSRSDKVFCLRSSQEIGLRLEPNGSKRTGQAKSRSDSFAMAMRIVDGNEESEAPDSACDATGNEQDCLINPSRTGWTARDNGVASSANGAPTVKLACETVAGCPETETGDDTAKFTWITSTGWRAPSSVKCFLDLKEITGSTRCAQDNEAQITRAMLAAKNNGRDPLGSHVFVVRVSNSEGSSETSYSWTILPGIPKVTIVPTNRAANDIPERTYIPCTVNGLKQWIDISLTPGKTCATVNAPAAGYSSAGDPETFSDREKPTPIYYARPTDSFVPNYPNRYESYRYRKASFRWHADIPSAQTSDDRIEQVYCLIERPVPGYDPGDPNYVAPPTGDRTLTQEDDWTLVTPGENFPCPGTVRKENDNRNWSGTINAEDFAGVIVDGDRVLPFHNDIPYRITVVATNQSGSSVRQRFIWFNADRNQPEGSDGGEVCFSPITGLARDPESGAVSRSFSIRQIAPASVSGIHRIAWPQIDSNWIGPNGGGTNGRVDHFFSGPQYPSAANIKSGADGVYTLGTWPAGGGPAHNVPRFFFPVVENGSPPYIPSAPSSMIASGPQADSFRTDVFYNAHIDHINAGFFSMNPDRMPPNEPSVSAAGGYNLTSGSPYYNVSRITLNLSGDSISGQTGCAQPAVRMQYRLLSSRVTAGDTTNGWTAWTDLPSTAASNLVIDAATYEGETQVQVRAFDAVGNVNGQLGTSDPATYYVRLDTTAPTAPAATYLTYDTSDSHPDERFHGGWMNKQASIGHGTSTDPNGYHAGVDTSSYRWTRTGDATGSATGANAFIGCNPGSCNATLLGHQGTTVVTWTVEDNAVSPNVSGSGSGATVKFDRTDPDPGVINGTLSADADTKPIFKNTGRSDTLSGVWRSEVIDCLRGGGDNTEFENNGCGTDYTFDNNAEWTMLTGLVSLVQQRSRWDYLGRARTTDRAGNVSGPASTGDATARNSGGTGFLPAAHSVQRCQLAGGACAWGTAQHSKWNSSNTDLGTWAAGGVVDNVPDHSHTLGTDNAQTVTRITSTAINEGAWLTPFPYAIPTGTDQSWCYMSFWAKGDTTNWKIGFFEEPDGTVLGAQSRNLSAANVWQHYHFQYGANSGGTRGEMNIFVKVAEAGNHNIRLDDIEVGCSGARAPGTNGVPAQQWW